MKKFSVLGLVLSLFAVFALLSCGKDDEPKKEEGNPLVGKVFFKQNKDPELKGDIQGYDEYTYSFSANQMPHTTKSYTVPDNGASLEKVIVSEYAYDSKTSAIEVKKVISATRNGEDITKEAQKDLENFKKSDLYKDYSLSYDIANQRLVLKYAHIVVKNKKEELKKETRYIPLKK